ncbi:MAG: AraC family ethanolamine operon transcriptional activator, partial [Candidatus Azotimanducaceae bacterium]
MKNNVPTTTIPAVSVFPLTDPSTVGDGVEVLDMDPVSLDELPFLALQTTVRLGSSVLLHQQSNCRLRTYTKLIENMMCFVAIGPRAKGTMDGVVLRPDVLTLSAPGCEAEFVVEAGYNSIS